MRKYRCSIARFGLSHRPDLDPNFIIGMRGGELIHIFFVWTSEKIKKRLVQVLVLYLVEIISSLSLLMILTGLLFLLDPDPELNKNK